MKLTKQSLKQKVLDLEAKNKELVSSFDLVKTEHITEIENLNIEVKEKQAKLDSKELKRLASAYKEQEDIYENESKFWLKWLMRIGGALAISTILSIWLSSGRAWYDRFEYYLIDFVFLSAVWFCSSNYSNFIKLRNDYANRKTIAQSFHNILNNLAEDEDIKDKFIEKATDVLCAPSFLIDKEPILSKKLIKDTAEIVKSVR